MAELKRRWRIYGASSRNEGKLLRGNETQAEMATDVGEPAPEGAEGRVLAGSRRRTAGLADEAGGRSKKTLRRALGVSSVSGRSLDFIVR